MGYVAAGIAFLIRQRRAANPLYDLRVAGRRVFWVAACAGTGATETAQQYPQYASQITAAAKASFLQGDQ